jgi:hypothetical protein
VSHIAQMVHDHVLDVYIRSQYSQPEQRWALLYSLYSFRAVRLTAPDLFTIARFVQLPCIKRSCHLELTPETFDVGGTFLQDRIVDWLHTVGPEENGHGEMNEESKPRFLYLSFFHIKMSDAATTERVHLFITLLIEQIKKVRCNFFVCLFIFQNSKSYIKSFFVKITDI